MQGSHALLNICFIAFRKRGKIIPEGQLIEDEILLSVSLIVCFVHLLPLLRNLALSKSLTALIAFLTIFDVSLIGTQEVIKS